MVVERPSQHVSTTLDRSGAAAELRLQLHRAVCLLDQGQHPTAARLGRPRRIGPDAVRLVPMCRAFPRPDCREGKGTGRSGIVHLRLEHGRRERLRGKRGPCEVWSGAAVLSDEESRVGLPCRCRAVCDEGGAGAGAVAGVEEALVRFVVNVDGPD